jgi:hypothetical protein
MQVGTGGPTLGQPVCTGLDADFARICGPRDNLCSLRPSRTLSAKLPSYSRVLSGATNERNKPGAISVKGQRYLKKKSPSHGPWASVPPTLMFGSSTLMLEGKLAAAPGMPPERLENNRSEMNARPTGTRAPAFPLGLDMANTDSLVTGPDIVCEVFRCKLALSR